MHTFQFAAVVTAIVLSTNAMADLRGKTAADAKLAADAYRDFVTVAGAFMACSSIEYAEVVDSKESGVNADEIWAAVGCGKSERFVVKFRPAPQGGYTYNISLEVASKRSTEPSPRERPAGGAVISNVDQLNALRPGETTADSVKATFGEPHHIDKNPDGRFVYLYPFKLPIRADASAEPMQGMVAFLFDSNARLMRLRLYEDKGRN